MTKELTSKEINLLVDQAQQVRENSYSPYSKFKVGAAVLTEDNKIFVGTNIENASFGLTVCAERNAIFAAICAGHTKFKALALITQKVKGVKFGAPCGACRQVMNEFFAMNTPIFIASLDSNGKRIIYKKTFKDLMPFPFSKI